MATRSGLRRRVRDLTSDDGLPDADDLPWYFAPVPEPVENLGLRLGWFVVVANVFGTAFGFWYYRHQFVSTPRPMWPFLPDSPLATLLFAAAVGAWLLDRHSETLCALAFVGNLVLGAWTPFVLLVFRAEFTTPPVLFQFLVWSHLAMIVQAFVLHRIAEFPPRAVGVAVLWYGANLLVDYFVPVLGDHPHHTALPVAPDRAVALGAGAHDVAAATAVLLVLLAVTLALSTGIVKRRRTGVQRGAADEA